MLSDRRSDASAAFRRLSSVEMSALKLHRFNDVGGFLDVAGTFLVAREAEHNLILGICSNLREAPDAIQRRRRTSPP